MNKVTVTKNFINELEKKSLNSEVNVIKSLSSKTSSFIDKLSNSTTDTILNFLENKTNKIRIRDLDSELYQYENLFLFRSNGKKAFDLEQNLKFLENLNISPKYVKYFQLGKEDFLTVLEGGKDDVIPYRQVVGRVLPEQKNTLISKLNKMLEKGFINKEVFANRDLLYVDKNNRLIIADWSNLSFVEGEEQARLKRTLASWKI